VYRFAPEVNAGKLTVLQELQAEWSRTLPLAFSWFWRPFLHGGLLPRNPPRSGPKSTFPSTRLVTSQKDLMAVAIEGQAKSWVSNLKNRIARSLMRDAVLSGDAGLRRQLLWINSMKAWLLPYREQVALLAAQPVKADALKAISANASRMMRKLVRAYIARFKLPDPRQLPMQVNQLSSVLAESRNTTTPWAAHWLRISTLERGRKIELPVMANPYAEKRSGRRATTFSLVEKEAGWYLLATHYITPTPWPEHHTEVLGIDLGLRTLMATSEGDLYGHGFLDRLRKYDAQLQRLQKGLQGAGQFRLAQCRRYRLLVARLRGWLKTTVQTHLRALLEQRRPKKVIVEDLVFAGQHGALSRRMNRLLRRFGQRYFLQTLNERKEEFGFELEVVEPAYSSQTCARCGFVHRENRSGQKFRCLACGHQAHADVNAGKNLARRSGQKASSAPDRLRNQWARSVLGWMTRQRENLSRRATSGLPVQACAVGCARAGLRALVERKSSAIRLSSESKRVLLKAAYAPTLDGLLDGLRPESLALASRGSTR
jgi:putative transposase